ncbi:MAG: formylmethanofuran dehydrogenase [Proteobacteria bacterium]|nr:formylmethanofuran dehydrogenase [Pseudomonadota bacterium]
MTAASSPADTAWTCPFCALLCDGYGAVAGPSSLALRGSDCPRAQAALARFAVGAPAPAPEIDGRPASLDDAIAACARLLGASRQPLFGGLGTDVAGMRALYRLACATGAICDAAGGDALTEGLRVLQDRGGFTMTLAEVRERADLIVCVGGVPSARFPEFFKRCGVFEARNHQAAVCLVGDGIEGTDAEAWKALGDRIGDRAEAVAGTDGGVPATVAVLAACVNGYDAAAAPPALAVLADRLRNARYAVLVYEPGRLGPHAALVIEALDRIVNRLNRTTRAATLALGGNDGAATANQVHAWLSGLPLRTRCGPDRMQHEPLMFGTGRLLADQAVDALLWVSSFEGAAPPDTDVPVIVLGPAHADRARAAVYIPVATPGIGARGHLFRTDGTVLMPLDAVRDDGLPGVAAIVQRIEAALARTGASA